MIATPGAGTRRAGWPFPVLAEPRVPLRDLDCGRRFHLENKALYREAASFRMSDAVLERFGEEHVAAQPEVSQELGTTRVAGRPARLPPDFTRHGARESEATVESALGAVAEP